MNKYRIKINDQVYEMEIELLKEGEPSTTEPEAKKIPPCSRSAAKQKHSAQAVSDGVVNSPMPGTVLKVNVKEGDMVLASQTVLILEAMKMENSIEAPKAGRIARLQAVEGETVASGDCLFVIE